MTQTGFHDIDLFEVANRIAHPGEQLAEIREVAPVFHDWFVSQGQVQAVDTFDLVGLPYPTEYALFRAHSKLASPFIRITNRMMVVQIVNY